MNGAICSIEHKLQAEMGNKCAPILNIIVCVFTSKDLTGSLCSASAIGWLRLYYCNLSVLRMKHFVKSVVIFPLHGLQVFYDCRAWTFSVGPLKKLFRRLGQSSTNTVVINSISWSSSSSDAFTGSPSPNGKIYITSRK